METEYKKGKQPEKFLIQGGKSTNTRKIKRSRTNRIQSCRDKQVRLIQLDTDNKCRL